MKEKIKVKGQLGLYLQWPLILSVLLVVMSMIIGAISLPAGLAMSGFTLLYIAIALWLYLYKRRRILAGMVEFSADYAWIQKQLLTDLGVPYAVADEMGRLLWMNQEFLRISKEEKNAGKSLMNLFPDITREILEEIKESTSIHSKFGDSKYRIDIKPVFLNEDAGEAQDRKSVV